MGLRESPYANSFLRGLNAVAQDLLFPTYWLLSQLLALQQTTAEKQARRPCPPHTLLVLTKGPVILLLLVLSAPFLLLGLVVWLPLQTVRRPFAYQHTPSQAPQPQEWMLPGKGRSFTFLCANLCLMPDGLAKFSNLAHTQWRAKRIALGLGQAASRSFLPDEPSARGRIQNGLGTPNGQKYGATGDSPPRACQGLPRAAAADVAITMPFREEEKASGLGQIVVPFPPNVDFVCLQEVFDQRATTRMRQLLGPWYEHIVYDVGVYGLYGCSAFKVLNSGLFLASRYPVLAVQYHCYPNGAGEDSFAAKGLLCVQVHLGASEGQRIVGYMNCTHLHAPETEAQIRFDQLSLGLLWAQLFQDANTQPGDIVAFDIYCGDLNFDNCSSGDAMEQNHEIFNVYTDPCRIGPRKDKPWAIGTLLNCLELYSEAVSTPENMKRTLEHAEGRQRFLAGPVLANGAPDLSSPSSEGRRIDYILYRQHMGPVELETAVEKFSFITQMATCSDHLAVGLQLSVTPAAQARA